MKKILIGFLFITITAGCGSSSANNIKIEERPITDFKEIHWNGTGELTIKQGSQTAIKLGAHKNYIDKIQIENQGDALIIKEESNWFDFLTFGKRKYLITTPDLNKVILKGVGDIKIENFKADDLSLVLKGKGDFKTHGLDLISLDTELQGLGNFKVSGKTNNQKVLIDGKGDYDALNLKSKNALVLISGIGTVNLDASDNLLVEIAGKGNVYYLNNPKIEEKINGIGKVEHY
ncbi:MAG: hypothetical protein GF332_04075 [Candidatus Moranbacteria bacterium]|nr:hypothetical protein [Candidatus Moranbacteria bacterium]